MTQVDAIFRNGVFEPLEKPILPENQRVRLVIQTLEGPDARTWLAAVQQRQQSIVAQRGHFPDSTADIAEDRKR